MIRIAVTQAAYDAIAATLPLESVGYEAQRSDTGFIWLERGALDRLAALRQPGEGYRRSFEIEASRPVGGADPVRIDDSYTEQRNPATIRAR
jgi:hypothetical protein